MGGIASVATTAIQALGAVNTVLGAVNGFQKNSGSQQIGQTKALNDLQNQQAQERAALEKEQIRLAAQNTENDRRAALRRAVARQRASYGAEGISSNDGSARAVLLGLFDESDAERNQREALDNLKKASIDQNVGQTARINTLQLTQLQEKNRINKYTSAFDAASSIFNS